jgi:hypothetical protein
MTKSFTTLFAGLLHLALSSNALACIYTATAGCQDGTKIHIEDGDGGHDEVDAASNARRAVREYCADKGGEDLSTPMVVELSNCY